MRAFIRNFFPFPTLGMATLLLSGCVPLGVVQGNTKALVQIDDVSTGALQTLPSVVVRNDTLDILYANRDGRVWLQSGTEKQALDTTARVKHGASYFQLIPTPTGGLQALWWSHQDGKNIYYTAQERAGQPFGRVSMVNDRNEVLPPFSVANGGDGKVVGVAYQDERLPRFQSFFNRSTDYGHSWPRPDYRLDVPTDETKSSFVQETHLVRTDQSWATLWVDTIASKEGAFRIVARTSADEGATWSLPKTVFSGQKHISALKVLASGQFIVAFADELKRGVFAVVSHDHGKTWKTLDYVAGSEEASNSGIEIALNESTAHAVWMQDREGQKTRVIAATLDLQTANWTGAATRIDTKLVENTRSEVPTIVRTTNGVVVAAWVDFRDIRPNIYMSASYDRGLSWTPPQPVGEPGRISMGWPKLIPWGHDVALAHEEYPADKVREGRFLVKAVSIGKEPKSFTTAVATKDYTEKQRKEKLEARIKALWAARIKGDHATAYDFFDFAYQASTPKKAYVDNSGVITYLTAAIDKMTINGNEAEVMSKIRYEVKPFILPTTGKPISVAPVDNDSPSTWVWVGDDWYLVYSPAFDVPILRY